MPEQKTGMACELGPPVSQPKTPELQPSIYIYKVNSPSCPQRTETIHGFLCVLREKSDHPKGTSHHGPRPSLTHLHSLRIKAQRYSCI